MLALQSEKLLTRPYIPMLKERNVRTGFFERDQLDAVIAHLLEPLQGMVLFAYLTGWRIPSEVLTLEWRQVDFRAGTVRLEVGTTKNDRGREFPLRCAPRAARSLGTAADIHAWRRTATGPDRPVGVPSQRETHPRLSWGVAAGQRSRRLSGAHTARLSPVGCAEPRAGWCLREGRHDAHGAQDPERL